MNLEILQNALVMAGVPVHRYYARKQTAQYIVWAEDGQGSALNADDSMEAQTITGTVDYFTRTENDPVIGKIQKALRDAGIPFSLNSVQFEPESTAKYIHYEWTWEAEYWLE